MIKNFAHPKKTKKCVLCKRWNGDADLVFKDQHQGFQFTSGVYGKCVINGASKPSTAGTGCKDYAPSVEAERLL